MDTINPSLDPLPAGNSRSWMPAVTGLFLAIGVTALMDANGLAMFSALPLALWMGLLWGWQKFSRAEVGMIRGEARFYRTALLYPLAVIGTLAILASLSGATDLSQTNWNHAALNLFVGGLSTMLVCIVTEEGFFRGVLWASLRRAGAGSRMILAITSLTFTLWHLSAVSLDTGFDLPLWQIPIYLVNATLIGWAWGALRMASGSMVVASVCHGAWNGLAYALFGFGETTGALGVTDTWIWAPEVGLAGIVLNSAVIIRYRRYAWP